MDLAVSPRAACAHKVNSRNTAQTNSSQNQSPCKIRSTLPRHNPELENIDWFKMPVTATAECDENCIMRLFHRLMKLLFHDLLKLN